METAGQLMKHVNVYAERAQSVCVCERERYSKRYIYTCTSGGESECVKPRKG